MSTRGLRLWLLINIGLILLIVGVGGVTRLTGSGLSITEWKPIMGAIPPLNETEWQEAFSKYQKIPQFERINPDMNLEGFKWIFFWEYLHRLIGRLIGIAYGVPLLIFLIRKKIPQGFRNKLLLGFFLGGAQGLLGWIMVKSGLTELSYVSHYRLAGHLLLAFSIAAYLLWIRHELGCLNSPLPIVHRTSEETKAVHSIRKTLPFVLFFIFLQTFYGALTAGLKAGYMYPTFPLMQGYWFHPDAIKEGEGLLQVFNNPTLVQTIHRALGTALVLFLMALWFKTRKHLYQKRERRALTAVAHLSATQMALGIGVVLLGVPVWAGAAHQVLGCLLFLLAFRCSFIFKLQTTEEIQ